MFTVQCHKTTDTSGPNVITVRVMCTQRTADALNALISSKQERLKLPTLFVSGIKSVIQYCSTSTVQSSHRKGPMGISVGPVVQYNQGFKLAIANRRYIEKPS